MFNRKVFLKSFIYILLSFLPLSVFAQAAPIDIYIQKVSDAAEPGTDGQFEIAISNSPNEVGVRVYFGVIGGSATEGEDYTFGDIADSVWFPAGTNTLTQTIDVFVIDDFLDEGTEFIQIAVLDATTSCCNELNIAGHQAVVYIEDDDTTEFQVYKWFSDGNPMPVDVTVTCTNASVVQATKPVSHNNYTCSSFQTLGKAIRARRARRR